MQLRTVLEVAAVGGFTTCSYYLRMLNGEPMHVCTADPFTDQSDCGVEQGETQCAARGCKSLRVVIEHVVSLGAHGSVLAQLTWASVLR